MDMAVTEAVEQREIAISGKIADKLTARLLHLDKLSLHEILTAEEAAERCILHAIADAADPELSPNEKDKLK